jgi:hypothetical protein
MALLLTCRITIGNYVFTHVNEVHIESSRKELVDVATIRLPRKYKSATLTSVIKEGDPVEVQLGYNGKLRTEFTGYVLKIGTRFPVEITCEDQMYLLKRTPAKAKIWATTTLKEVIHHLVPTGVIEVPQITLAPYYIKGKLNVATVLEKLKDQYGLDVFYRPDGKLYVGLGLYEKQSAQMGAINYDMTKNVINNDMQFRTADAIRIRLKMISMQPNGKHITYEGGDGDGEVKTLHEYNLKLEDMKKLIDSRIKLFKSDRCDGQFETFGIPFAQHGMTARVYDPYFPDQKGSYFIDKVETKFGVDGYRRTITPGKKAS